MKKTLVVLDVDGTLIDSMALEAIVYPAVMREHLGVQRISSDWESYEGTTDPAVTDEIYIRHVGRRPTVSELGAFLDLYVSRLASSISSDPRTCIAIPGAINFLREISGNPAYRVVVATGAWRRSIELKLHAAGIDLSGVPFLCADEWPDRNSIISAAAHSLGRFDRTVLIGDAPWDAAAARDLGIDFVGIGQGAAAEVLKGAGATQVIADFSDITAVFDAIKQAEIPGVRS